jgi:peptide subunit release factor RF-3
VLGAVIQPAGDIKARGGGVLARMAVERERGNSASSAVISFERESADQHRPVGAGEYLPYF